MLLMNWILIQVSLLLSINDVKPQKVLSLFDMLEKSELNWANWISILYFVNFSFFHTECYGQKTKKIGVCTITHLCQFGMYQPFLNVDTAINMTNYECAENEICCTKGLSNPFLSRLNEL